MNKEQQSAKPQKKIPPAKSLKFSPGAKALGYKIPPGANATFAETGPKNPGPPAKETSEKFSEAMPAKEASAQKNKKTIAAEVAKLETELLDALGADRHL